MNSDLRQAHAKTPPNGSNGFCASLKQSTPLMSTPHNIFSTELLKRKNVLLYLYPLLSYCSSLLCKCLYRHTAFDFHLFSRLPTCIFIARNCHSALQKQAFDLRRDEMTVVSRNTSQVWGLPTLAHWARFVFLVFSITSVAGNGEVSEQVKKHER